MTKTEKAWYTRGRVDQLGRKPFIDWGNVALVDQGTARRMYEAGADSVTADEQDLYAETLAEIREYEDYSPAVAALFIADYRLAQRRLLALQEPMPEVVNA